MKYWNRGIWTGQLISDACYLKCTDLISTLCWHWILSRGFTKSNGRSGLMAIENQRNPCSQYAMVMRIMIYLSLYNKFGKDTDSFSGVLRTKNRSIIRIFSILLLDSLILLLFTVLKCMFFEQYFIIQSRRKSETSILLFFRSASAITDLADHKRLLVFDLSANTTHRLLWISI